MGFESEIRLYDLEIPNEQIDLLQIIDVLFKSCWYPGINGKILTIDIGNDMGFVEIPFDLTGCHKLYELLKKKIELSEFISINFSHQQQDKMIQLSYDFEPDIKVLKFTILCEERSKSTLNPRKYLYSYLHLLKDVVGKIANPNVEFISGYGYDVIETFKNEEVFHFLDEMDTHSA